MKRFYKQATIAEKADGFVIELDGREVKTPEKRLNLSPTKTMAEAICQEWNDQKDKVEPESMLITKMQNTAIDRVETRRTDLIAELIHYAKTDMLCYRTDYPEELVKLQSEVWQPLMDWVSRAHGMALKVTTGIIPIDQDPDQIKKLDIFLKDVDSYRLAAFYNITTLCGSVSVALNVLGGNITADQAWQAAQLDEDFQIDQWGMDDEAKIRQENMKKELDAATYFLALCPDPS